MPLVPAFCANCGTVFASGIFLDQCSSLTITNYQCGPCPRCGGQGHVPDGIYDTIGDAIRLFTAQNRTEDEYLRLASILTLARAQQLPYEEVARQIRQETPAFKGVERLLKPKTCSDFMGLLSVMIGLIALLLQLSQQKAQTEITVEMVITHIINQLTPPRVNLEPRESSSQQADRNDLCSCGSGKKYENCCGSSK